MLPQVGAWKALERPKPFVQWEQHVTDMRFRVGGIGFAIGRTGVYFEGPAQK